MKNLVSGIIFTAAIGLVGCGGKDRSQEDEPVKKTENKTEVVERERTYADMQITLRELQAKIEGVTVTLKEGAAGELEKKLAETLKFLTDFANADKETIEATKTKLEAILANLDALDRSKVDTSEKVAKVLNRLDDLEKSLNTHTKQTVFHKACIASLNVADADDDQKRNVLNAIAFVNTSKIARATEVKKADFEKGSKLDYGSDLGGIIFSGTHSEFRKVDESYTFYAFSRLPSPTNYSQLRYHSFTDDASVITGLNADRVQSFLLSDQDHNYHMQDVFNVLNEQNPLRAIDANKIESYSRTDCDRVATYMANVGSHALTTSVDDPTFVASRNSSSVARTFGGDIREKLNNKVLYQIFLLGWTSVRSRSVPQRLPLKVIPTARVSWSFKTTCYAAKSTAPSTTTSSTSLMHHI